MQPRPSMAANLAHILLQEYCNATRVHVCWPKHCLFKLCCIVHYLFVPSGFQPMARGGRCQGLFHTELCKDLLELYSQSCTQYEAAAQIPQVNVHSGSRSAAKNQSLPTAVKRCKCKSGCHDSVPPRHPRDIDTNECNLRIEFRWSWPAGEGSLYRSICCELFES